MSLWPASLPKQVPNAGKDFMFLAGALPNWNCYGQITILWIAKKTQLGVFEINDNDKLAVLVGTEN